MFDRNDQEIKISHMMQDRTASQLGESNDDSVTYEVEAEREYVNRLKCQREKVSYFLFRSRLFILDMMFF